MSTFWADAAVIIAVVVGVLALFYVGVLVFSWLLAKIVDEDVWTK